MGLFFDQDWFDSRLQAAGLTRAALAQASGMTIDEIEQVYQDQRELEPDEVRAFARLLGREPREVANRSGAADPGSAPQPSFAAASFGDLGRDFAPEPQFVVTREVITGLHERMDRLEQLLEMVLTKIDRIR